MGKIRALLSLIRAKVHATFHVTVVSLRFIRHPGDFLRLYQRESEVANSALDFAMMTVEHDLLARIEALESRIAELEAHRATFDRAG